MSGSDFFCLLLVVSYFLFHFVQLCPWIFVGFSFSEITLDICELLLSLLGIRVVMQCNDAIIWVLVSLPLLPFWGNQVQGTLYWGKKSV